MPRSSRKRGSNRKSASESASSSSPQTSGVSKSSVGPKVQSNRRARKSKANEEPRSSGSVLSSRSIRSSTKSDAKSIVEPAKQESVRKVVQGIGLLRDQLDPYRNDDSWITTRYTLLAMFWVFWFSMVIAVIVIVVLSPECPSKPNLPWWQRALFYEVWLPKFYDSNNDGVGDLDGLRGKLRYLAKNVKPDVLFIRPSIFRASECCDGFWVESHRDVQPDFGTLGNFRQLIREAHRRDIRIVIDFPISIISIYHGWFDRLFDKDADPEFRNFFHWTSRKKRKNETKAVKIRFSKNVGVVLNWDQEIVHHSLLEEAKFWIDRRVDGFHISLVELMDVNPKKMKSTKNLDNIASDLKKFIGELKHYARGRELFVFTSLNHTMAQNLSGAEFEAKLTKESSGLDAILSPRLFYFDEECKTMCLWEELRELAVSQIDSHNWYTLGGPDVWRLADRLGQEMAQMYNLLFLMLPGAVTIYYGDEMGMIDDIRQQIRYELNETTLITAPMPWTHEDSRIDPELAQFSDGQVTTNVEAQLDLPHGHLSMVRRLVTARKSAYAINYGQFQIGPEDEDLLVVNVSSHLSPTHFIILLHFGDSKTYNLADKKFALDLTRCHVTLVAGTENLYLRDALVDRQTIDLTKIELRKNEALVVRVRHY